MKKFLCILITAGILFSTASCGIDGPESSNLPLPQETRNTTSNETLDSPISGSYESYEFLGFSSLSEYEEHFTAQGGYPDGFITYDDLKLLGEFSGFVSQSYYGNNPDYSYYHYSIMLPNGIEISVNIYPEWLPQKQWLWDIASVKSTMLKSDLRTNRTGETRGTVLIEDVLYSYLLGKLRSVTWRSGGQEIRLSGDFDQIPEESNDSLIGRLLSYNTAKGAIAELKQITATGSCEYKGIYTFEEYQKMTASGNPKEFISYDDLKWLGDFEGFVAPLGISTYFIRHPSGVGFTVHIYPEQLTEQLELERIRQVESVKDTLAGSDLRTNSTTKDLGTVLIGDALYTYISGKLRTIQWEIGGQQIRIYAAFDKLPTKIDDEFLGKLLDFTYAESATLELQRLIDID